MSAAVKAIIVVVVLAALGGGGYAVFHKSSPPKSATTTAHTTSTSKQTASQPSQSGPTPLTSTATTALFTINANDSGADHETLNVVKGATVALTFKVDTDGVYHGGLQFKSTDPKIDSGPIQPGGFKTVTFTADHSFSFTPYWYASQIKKDYLIQVNVQ